MFNTDSFSDNAVIVTAKVW